MQNIEIKHELRDVELCRQVLPRLGANRVGVFRQRDTYFRVAEGRLKKRETDDDITEWILYHRQDRLTPRLSNFRIFPEPEGTVRFGEHPMPVWVVVEKARELWMLDGIRIHLDDVAGLGWFFEAEALVTPRQHAGECRRLVEALISKLGPVLGEPISGSYSDLLAQEQGGL